MSTNSEVKKIKYFSSTSDGSDRHHFVVTTDWGEVTFTYDTETPNAEPVRIVIEPVDGATLTPEALRRVRLSGLRSQAARRAEHPLVKWMAGIDPDSPEPWLADPRPGMRGREDRDYARWAKRYVDALEESSHPVKRLAENHPGHSPDTIRQILNKARHRGLLTKSPKGRAGGWLTKQAEALLEETRSD